MEREAKKEKSIGIGTTTFFLSCFGISIYDQASHDSYTNYQDKLPFKTIFVTSAVTGIILAIITWLVLTLYDCHKKAREDGSATTISPDSLALKRRRMQRRWQVRVSFIHWCFLL